MTRKFENRLRDAIDAQDHEELRRIFAAHPRQAAAARLRNGTPILFEAIRMDDPVMARIFLENGADVNEYHKPQNLMYAITPLMQAVSQKEPDIALIETLLAFKAHMHARTADGHSALHTALWPLKLDAATFLVRAGCDINAINNFGDTPLHWAAGMKDTAMTEFLLERGARRDILNGQGETARDVAKRNRLQNQLKAFDRAARKIARAAASGTAQPLRIAPKIALRKAGGRVA